MELTLKQKLSLIKFNVVPFDSLNYDVTLAADASKWEDLIRFVCTYYQQDTRGWKAEQYEEMWKNYQSLITVAIKANNILGLEVLWKGIYHHDRSNPDFVTDVYTAVEFANLETLHHVLYGYMNYMDLNLKDNLEYTKLKDLAKNNPHGHVLDFINDIQICADDKNKIREWSRNYIKKKVFSEKEWHVRGRMYYTIVNRYSKKY